MTSTNDGSNLRSGQKDKRYYIERFQSLEARLNGPASTEQRTQNVCEAWRLVHGLCSHSTPDTRSHLLSWIQRNTAYAILQDEWRSPENKPQHVLLEKAINDFILECHKTDNLLVWETTLLRRAVWYKGVLSNPWGHAVLKALLDPKGIQPTDQEVIGWLREERAMMFVTRLRVMARAKRLIDLALVLVSAVMTRARRAASSQSDASQADAAPGIQGGSKSTNFVESLSREAGFTKDVWELLIDIEFVLLHKQDQSTCIDLAKKIPLKDGKRIVERLRFRLDKSPSDKKLWKKAKDVAILIAQVVITRCMVVTSCAGAVLDALTGCASALAQLLDGSRLPQAAAALAAPAATATHLYAFADAIAHQCKDKIDRQPFICELYVRAITAGMNELERLKLEKDKEPEVCALQHTLSGWFTQLGEVLSSSARLRCECLLTAFSLHPSANMYELVVALPPLAKPDKSPKQETSEVTSEFGSWATDSRTSSNFVKTSETLKLKQTQKQTNILSSSMFDTECDALGLKSELCEDLAVLLSGPRVKTLSWDMDRETLLENCRLYKERTQEGTKALTMELKYLNLDPKSYDHLPEEEDDEDNYYGIEKGYEPSLEYEDIWSDNNIDYTERCESACSISTVDSTKTLTKSKNKKNPVKYYGDEIDPLSFDTPVNCNQNTSENSKNLGKKQNDGVKKKSKPRKCDNRDMKKLSESDQEELIKKQKRKERRERKKREKMEMLLKQELQIGMNETKILSVGMELVTEKQKQKTDRITRHVSATDSDYDSQGKSSLASINSDGNDTSDVLFDGLFSMDEIRSPENITCNKLSATHDINKEQKITKQKGENQNMVTDKLKKLLQFRNHKKQINFHNNSTEVSKYIENTNSTSNNIYGPEGIKPQVQGTLPNVNTFKITKPEKLNNNLKQSGKFDGLNASKRNLSGDDIIKKNYAPSQKQFQAFSGNQAAARTSGLLISDLHQKQFQEFLKLQNVPITNDVTRQPTTTKVIQSGLAQRNPVLTGLIQQKPELCQNVNSVKDFNEPGRSLINAEVQKLQNLPTIETKKHLKPQKHGVDNVPNTFSRLSYLHKNKQADMKYKQSNEQEQVKTQMAKIIDNESFVKINNLQANGEIFISKTLKRNSMAVNRENPPPSIRQGDRIPNPSTSATMNNKDLRLNIVNVSKFTKEIVENKVIIKKYPKTTMPVDLQYIIHQTNLDVRSNWKSQYPNTTIKKSIDVSPVNVGNSSNDYKAVALGIVNKDTTNDMTIQQENCNNVIVSHSGQFNSNDDSRTTQDKEGGMENSEDWKFVMNKLRSLKSAKKSVDALEMALSSNSSIKGCGEILRNLHKHGLSSKGPDSRDHIKAQSKQKVRTSLIDSKQTVIKNEIVQKSKQPGIKKVTKKAVAKCNEPTKSILKTSNVVMPSMHNSDYDQLDDLIDDELRQEIEESSPLNTEDDIIRGAARVTTAMPEKEKLPKIESSQEKRNSVQSSNVNYNMKQTSGQSSIENVLNAATRTCSVIKENTQGPALKPKLHIISDKILSPFTKSSGSKNEKTCFKSNISENRSSVIAGRPISYSQKMSCVTGSNVSIITSPINIVHPANVILKNISHKNTAQNLMIITPKNTISNSNHSTQIIEQQLPLTSNVNNQTAYVLKPQNQCLFSSPQISVQAENPSIIENSTINEVPSVSNIYTESPKPHHRLCSNDILKSKVSKEYVSVNKRTEVISQPNIIGHKLYVNHTKDSKIESNGPKEEIIQSHSNNQNVGQYCDEVLKTNLIEGQSLPICPNQTRDCKIDIHNKPIKKNHLQRTDEASNTKTKNETEFIHSNREIMMGESESIFPNKNEFHRSAGLLPKSVSKEESKYYGDFSKHNKTKSTESNELDNIPKNIIKEKERSPSILSESYDIITDVALTKDVGSEIAKTETDYINNEKERSPSILSEHCDQIIDLGKEIYKTEKYQDNNDCKQFYTENDFKLCVDESVELYTCSKSEKRLKLDDQVCKPQEVKILNEPIELTLSTKVETDRDFDNEKNLVSKISNAKSYDSDVSHNHNKPNMSVTIYVPQKKIFESSTIDNMPTKFCERKVLSQVQENQLAKASEVTENKKNLKHKHSLDDKLHSDIETERLRNKRLSIIHRKINHHIVSEPIALMYAPIYFEKSIGNDKVNNCISPSQKNVVGKTEQRQKLDNNSNETTSKITSAEESSLNREHLIDKSNKVPTRRLRSSNSFRSSKSTVLDKSKLILPDSGKQTYCTNTIEAKKTAPKRSSENDASMDNSVMKIQKNELRDFSHKINEIIDNNKEKYIDEIHRDSNLIHSTADTNTIDLTDTEPTEILHSINKVPNCGSLNKENVTKVKNTIPLDRPLDNACKPKRSVQSTDRPNRLIHKISHEANLKKEVAVLEIKELPSPNGDVMKKILRIKLSNGNIFRATVTGNLKVDIKTVLSEPSIKSLLNTNILQRKSCTVNVKHITDSKNDTTKKEVTISGVLPRKPDSVNTEVIELSDDEDDNVYYFKTEFGTYKTKSINSKTYDKHQNKLLQKCTVKLHKSEIVKDMNLNSHKKSVTDVTIRTTQNDIGSDTKIGDITNECGSSEKMNYSETINAMEQSEINSISPYSKSERTKNKVSDTLQNVQSPLLESQIVQLRNVCRVNLERCDQQLQHNDSCIISTSKLKEHKDISPLNEEDNDKISIIRSNSFSLLDRETLDGNTLRSAKHGNILQSFDQNYCNSEWILCTKSMFSLEAKRIMQRKYLKSVHYFGVKPSNVEECKSNDFFPNLSCAERNDEITLRPESPSIIADFESRAKQSSYSWVFDQSHCNSDWMLCTKASIHSLEVKKQKCVKTVLDLQVKVDINSDSSTDCDSDLEFHDIRQKNEEQEIAFQVPSLRNLVYTLITSDVDILDRYTIQKHKNSDVFNSPTHNLKRKHNTSDKRNNCKISKNEGNSPSCEFYVPLSVIVDKKGNNVNQNIITGESDHPIIVETTILYTKDDIPKFENDLVNEANLDKTDSALSSDSTNNNNNIHTCEENISNLEFEITKENNLPINKSSKELQTFTNKNNCNNNKLEIDDQKLMDAMENFREVPLQMQNIEMRRELERPEIVGTTIQHTIDCMTKFVTVSANESNLNENEDNVVSVSKVLCHTGSKLENSTVDKTTIQCIKDTMPNFFNEAIEPNVDNVIYASKVVCETEYCENINNHEREENESNSEFEVSQDDVIINNTNKDMQIFINKNDNNKNQLNDNDEKPMEIMENGKTEQTQMQDFEKERELKHPEIVETTIQHTKSCMSKFTTTSVNETNLDENEDNVVSNVSPTGTSNDVDNCEGMNHTDKPISFFSCQHTDNNKDIKVSINNVVNQTSSTGEVFESEKYKNNEDTMLNTLETVTIQSESDSIPLIVSEEANNKKSEYNLCNSQRVVLNTKLLCDSEKLTQEVDFEENTNVEKETENGYTNETKTSILQEISKKLNYYAVETPLKLSSSKSNLKDKSITTTECDNCGIEDMLKSKEYNSSEEILEKPLVTAGIEIPSAKPLNSSTCKNINTSKHSHMESFSNNIVTKNNSVETDTSISYKIELSTASEDKTHILDKDQSLHQSLKITNSEEKVIKANQNCETICHNSVVNQSHEIANSSVSFKNSTRSFMSPECFIEPKKINSEYQLQKIHPEVNKNTSDISENKEIIENFSDDDRMKVEENNKRRQNEHESVTLIYKGNSNVVLKGSPYVDPVVGTCYIFPLSSSTCSRKEFTSLNANMIKSLRKKSVNENDNEIEQSNLSLILPKITYSRHEANQTRNGCSNKNTRQLKRKSDSKSDCKLERKYRKGKNIDTCKLTTEIYAKIAYAGQYKRLLEYCTTIKFSYSRPFHKNSIDPASLLKNWPIQNNNNNNYSTAPLEEDEKVIFIDNDKENKTYFDPLQQTLAEEIAMDYNNENEYSQLSKIEDYNFNMGFGEVSDRVIQNLANGIYTSKFSAATLSDVKLPQPFSTSRDKKQNIPQIIKKSNDEELANMKRCISFIQLRDKVKDFFRKSASELHCNFNLKKRSSKTVLYDLTSPQFFYPPTQVAVVNVVQVGQLPVSASAQNPVTCDPRVTHVSNASPPQCSAENSPDGDQNASKTEYTELTTADLSLPLVQEYQQSSQVIMSSQSQLSVPVASKVSMDINCESKLEHQEEIVSKNENAEVTNNFLHEHKNIHNIAYSYNPENDSFKSGNSYKSEIDSYKSDSIHKTEKNCKPESNALQSENSRTLDIESQNAIFDSLLKEDNDYVFKVKTTNGTSEKTDQIAHAMNAAGITTGTDSISNNNRAHALVNILSQKIRQNNVNTTQTSVNSYTKGSPINAMALQQALAQILPPPLNQTNSSDHQNASITPQVLHIVQGKNTSGNQITIVDNQQNSVINNSNNTPVLHIVQNKSAICNSTSNSNSATQNNNSFSGLSLVDAGIQQGGNQLLHIVNTGQKNSTSGQLLKRVNLLTNLTNVQGNNEQKMVQFVCKSADGKSIQLNAPHQRSMVLRLQPIESTNVPNAAKSEGQDIIQSPNFASTKENNNTQQEIKSRSVYEENYAKFIQNSSPKPAMPEKSTSLPKFNQAFGKQVFQDNNQKNNELQSNSSSHVANTNTSTENVECSSNDNAINLEHINQINSPPLLLRKSPAQTSQSQQGQSNLVQQIKQTIAPVNIQTMHGGVIYTRQIPVNIGGGQTINLITVPSTDLIDETGQKQQGEVKFVNQNEIEPSIIKIVPQSQNSSTSEGASEDNSALNATNDTPNTTTATHTQPVLTQMRIKLPMLSKTPQMVSGARLVRPSFFQIQRNVIGGANQPVYQQLVLTAAPSLGQQTVRPPQAQPTRVKTSSENQTSSESQMSSSTLEQLREFDMVLEQVKERSTVQPNSNTNNTYTKLQSPTETTDSNPPTCVVTTEPTQQVLYSIGNNNSLNVAYVSRKPATTTPATSTFARSPDSSGVADSPTSSSHVPIPAHSSSNETSSDTSPQQSQPKPKSSSKSKSRPKTSSNPTTSMKINTVPPKTSTQKPLEDEQTTQRILYILAEYKEQVENSPDKDKPAPRRRSNPPSNPGSSKRKKSSSGSRRPGGRDMSPIHGEDTCRTMGSEDSSCGTSQGDCTENCLETHSPQDSPRKVVRKLTFENETSNTTPRQQPARNVIVADGQTITVARGTAGKPATAVLMPANYILPVSMVKGGQQIAIVTNRGPKILTVGGEGGGNALLLQRLIGPAGLKPVLARPGVRHVRLPTASLHNLQAFNIATAANVQPPDSTASPAPAPTPPDLVETRATSSPWPDRDSQDVKPERSSSPEGSEPWNLPSSADPHDYSYEETVRAENLDRTVLDAIPDRYSPDLEAQRIFDKMFDVDTKKSYIDSQDNSPRCGYDIDASDCDDKGYQQVVQKRDQRQHRLAHVSAAALRHKYAILEHELRLQKSLSEECEDLGVDSPSASELFPEAELLFASSPAHESSHHGHTPQPGISQSTIPQPDMDDQIATDQLLNRTLQDDHQDLDVTLGLDESIVTVSEDGMQATITLDQEEFARSHPNTTFHSEPTEEENVQPYTVSGIKGRHITSTIFHAGRAPATVLMTAPQTTVISQAMPDQQHTNIKYIDNIMNPGHNNICLSSVLVKDDGLTKYDNILNDSRELHLSNTASAIVHSNTTQVIRRVCYDDDKRDSRFLLDETDALIAGDDAKMIVEDSSRDATLESIADDRSSPERHTELFWESNSASERSDSRRPLDFSSDSDKCCKSPIYDETNSTDSSGVGTHMRLDSVIKDARGLDRSGSADNSSADDTLPPLRTYPPKRMYHVDGEMERSVSGKTRAGERSPDGHEVRRRASVRGVVKRGCHCCNGSPAPPRPKKSRQKKPSIDFNN